MELLKFISRQHRAAINFRGTNPQNLQLAGVERSGFRMQGVAMQTERSTLV
jgi:hypothetical protein